MSPPCSSSTLARLPSALAAIWGLSACHAKHAPPGPPPVQGRAGWPSPMADTSPRCTDVADLRVCWGAGGGPSGIVVTPRAAPPVALSPLGSRCSGAGAARICFDRALRAEAFRCEGSRCEQPHPRVPDAGEWECADIAGAVFCRGGEPPAGSAPGGSDPAFVCAPRVAAGASAAAGTERICVDWSPDFPEGHASGTRCRFESPHGLPRRVCEKDPRAHSVGDGCDRGHPCIDGLVCAGGRCVPSRPEPSCWLDGDCDQGRRPGRLAICRFGTCTSESP